MKVCNGVHVPLHFTCQSLYSRKRSVLYPLNRRLSRRDYQSGRPAGGNEILTFAGNQTIIPRTWS